MRHWTLAYLGRPYRAGAAGPDAFDCWGLVRRVMAEQAGAFLPAMGIDPADLRSVIRAMEAGTAHAGLSAWCQVDGLPARELDVCLLTRARHSAHCGVWVGDDRRAHLLHVEDPAGVVAPRTADLAPWRILHRYRLVGLA